MKILFLGTHGQFNLGDDILLETFLLQLGREHQYAVTSHDPHLTENYLRSLFKAEAFHVTGELSRFLKHLFTSDLVFFGGGSIVRERQTSEGGNPYSDLCRILAIVTFAKLVARKKVMMSNIGIGPLTTWLGEFIARMILNQVDFISVRDERSHRIAIKLGLSSLKVTLVPDVVFINSPELFIDNPKPFPPSDKTRIALNLNYEIENREAWEPFLQNLAAALTEVNAATPLEIHALPMQCRHKTNDDLSILREFSQRIQHIPFVLHEPQTIQEAAEIIANVDMVLAERLQALVVSSILGKPFFGLVYDVKVRELVNYMGAGRYALNINQPFKSGHLAEGIRHVLQKREPFGVYLTERSAKLRVKLGAYFDELKTKAFQH